jgi:hypothetical protein
MPRTTQTKDDLARPGWMKPAQWAQKLAARYLDAEEALARATARAQQLRDLNDDGDLLDLVVDAEIEAELAANRLGEIGDALETGLAGLQAVTFRRGGMEHYAAVDPEDGHLVVDSFDDDDDDDVVADATSNDEE